MMSIGLDIGTTTICGIAVDEQTGDVLDSVTLNNAFICGGHEWEKIQSPQSILETVRNILNRLIIKHKNISCIGITGQMHGIVYVDKKGDAVSPLYTWQDGRGDLEYKDKKSYAEYISKKTDYRVATGYGSVTHFYNTVNKLVDSNACSFCTIHDYVAMKLSRNIVPYTDATDGASLGLFDLENNAFSTTTINDLGLDYIMFPKIVGNAQIIGETDTNIPVIVAVGDNQASFIGSVREMSNSVLVNVGTGSQISLHSKTMIKYSESETRPCVNNDFLLVGASLCGGRAYAMLGKFYNDVVEMATGKRCSDIYDIMEKGIIDSFNTLNPPEIITAFCGTREDSNKKGSIWNIGTDNFTPQSFTLAMLNGIVTELYDMYGEIKKEVNNNTHILIGSGNGIRKNKLLQKIFTQKFDMQLLIPAHKEEAAYGVAINALVGIGKFKDINEAQGLIKYEGEKRNG